ncbi:MAG: hypothetical protein AB7J28_12915 [Hyphomonadaceae bacterium]
MKLALAAGSLGFVCGFAAIALNVYQSPMAMTAAMLVGAATLIALGLAVIDFASHVLSRSEAQSAAARTRAAAAAAFIVGALCSVLAAVVMIALSVWVGGLA